MVICQTLWTNRKNLLKDSFGWLSPQHHLMGWALSCLKLSRYHKNVQLFTDRAGKELLSDYLGLPYTRVFEDYDNLDYEPYLWALPKLETYSRQDQPFLHVDGDVLLWEPFAPSLLSASLITQNLEKGTEYYKNKFEPLLKKLKYLPRLLKPNLTLPYMYGYNAGIMGGNDISFFKKYVSLAVQFLEKNRGCKLDGNVNMIFEQLLFHSLAKREKKPVSCLKEELINDNGYDQKRFADFARAAKLGYLHLIGPHKRSKDSCDWLARYLFQENQEIFLRITALFKEQHFFYNKKNKELPNQLKITKRNKFYQFVFIVTLERNKALPLGLLLAFVNNTLGR